MTVWQFLASLPVGIWYALAGTVVLAVLLLCGGTVTTALVTIFRGGKVKITKSGVEADAPEADKDEPPAPPTGGAQ